MSGCCSFLPCCPERVSFKGALWEALPDSIAWRGQVRVIDPKDEPGCCETVILSRIFAETIAGLSFLDVPGNIILATLKLASLPIVLIVSSCSECCAVFWQAMGNYYDAICDLLLGMTVLFSWVYPDVVYSSMQNAKIDSFLRAISQEYTTLNKAVEMARAIGAVTEDLSIRTRVAAALLDKLNQQPLAKESVETVFTLVNVLIKGVSSEDPVATPAMVETIKKAASQVPPWENLPLLFQVIDSAHVHFTGSVGVRVTCTQITLREVMKKEGCSAENLLSISQKLRKHFNEEDKIYKQQIAEEIGTLIQDEARFGKEGSAKIFAEVETHYFPDFQDHLTGSFDWKTLTERYKPATTGEKKTNESLSSDVVKTETLDDSDAESEDSLATTPEGSSLKSAQTPADPSINKSVQELITLLQPDQLPAEDTNWQSKSAPVSPQARFVPIEETVSEGSVTVTVDAPTPFVTPASKCKLGPPQRVSANEPQELESPPPVNTENRNWLLQTAENFKKPAANTDTLPFTFDMSPGTQVALNTDALNAMGLSPFSPLPHPINEEITADLSSNEKATFTKAEMVIVKELARSSSTPSSNTNTGAENGNAHANGVLTSSLPKESGDVQHVKFHDGEDEKKSE